MSEFGLHHQRPEAPEVACVAGAGAGCAALGCGSGADDAGALTFCIGGRGFALVCLVTARLGEAERLPTFSTATLEEATGSAVDELAVGGVAMTQATDPRNTAEAIGAARAREPHPARDPRGLIIITLAKSTFIA